MCKGGLPDHQITRITKPGVQYSNRQFSFARTCAVNAEHKKQHTDQQTPRPGRCVCKVTKAQVGWRPKNLNLRICLTALVKKEVVTQRIILKRQGCMSS